METQTFNQVYPAGTRVEFILHGGDVGVGEYETTKESTGSHLVNNAIIVSADGRIQSEADFVWAEDIRKI